MTKEELETLAEMVVSRMNGGGKASTQELTPKQVQRVLADHDYIVEDETIRTWCRWDQLPSHKTKNGRGVRIWRTDVDAFIQSGFQLKPPNPEKLPPSRKRS